MDEREVYYLKDEVITFVVVLFSIHCRFKVKVNVRSRLLSVSSIFYYNFILIDEMQIIENC
jgi:hypothetical protein